MPSGAKLGAIHYGLQKMAVDACGRKGPLSRALWTVLDTHGYGLEIDGSGG